MKYDEAIQGYHVSLRHDPSQFYPNRFRVEVEGRTLILVGVVKRHIQKRFRVVAVLTKHPE